MKSFVSIFKSSAFKIALLVGLCLTSLLIILAMLLGNESGNFVFQVEDGDIEKSISITENLEGEYYSRLVAEGQKSWLDTTLGKFLGGDGKDPTDAYNIQYNKLVELTSVPGRQVIDNYLYIYTFYIVNTGSSVLDLSIQMNMSNITKGLDGAIRILTFNEADTQINIYQKKDEETVVYPNYYISQPKTFASSSRVYSEEAFVRTSENGSKNYIKYSVLFWLEGNDPDCVNEGPKSVAGGTIKFNVDIKVKS